MCLGPSPQSATHFPPSKTNAHSSFRVEARTMSPGCKRRTDILIHFQPACSRAKCKSSPDFSEAKSREWTRKRGSLTSSPLQRMFLQNLLLCFNSNRFETIKCPLSCQSGQCSFQLFLPDIYYQGPPGNTYSTRLGSGAEVEDGRRSDRWGSVS